MKTAHEIVIQLKILIFQWWRHVDVTLNVGEMAEIAAVYCIIAMATEVTMVTNGGRHSYVYNIIAWECWRFFAREIDECLRIASRGFTKKEGELWGWAIHGKGGFGREDPLEIIEMIRFNRRSPLNDHRCYHGNFPTSTMATFSLSVLP